MTYTNPELRDPGESSGLEEGLRAIPWPTPHSAERTSDVQGLLPGAEVRAGSAPMAPPLFHQAPRRWSVLLEGDCHQWSWFQLAVT